jgi:hypothetical protein
VSKEQLNLWDAPPHTLARTEHPETSLLGAQHVQDKLGALQREVLLLVCAHPRSTTSELAEINRERDPRRIGRRLPELRNASLVRVFEERRCRVTKRPASSWEPTEQGVSWANR